MSVKIAIVNSSSFGLHFPHHLERLEKIGEVKRFRFAPDAEDSELIEALDGYDYIIASVTPNFGEEFFDNVSNLKLVSRHGIGFNNVNLVGATNNNVYVSKIAALVEQQAVAEQAWANLMAVLRQSPQSSKAIKEGRYSDRAKFMAYEIKNKRFGIIGCGNIGSGVAKIASGGFNCEVVAYDPYKTKEQLEEVGVKKVELDELLSTCRFISLNASLTETSYHMINKETISKMMDDVYITNSARGALWVEEDIMEALDSGKIAGLGTDVMEVEPASADHPFLKYENVLVTPHTAAYTYECLEQMGEKCVEDVERVHAGLVPNELVNKDVLDK